MTASSLPYRVSIVALYIVAVALSLAPILAHAQGGRVIYVDVQKGSDSNNTCLDPTAPCRTIQHAVNQAASGDTILVAAGVYTYAGVDNPCERYLGGRKAVVCIVNKTVTLHGGYASGNWSSANPTTHLTVIDGENRVRGVWVQGTAPQNPQYTAGIEMEGFTIRRGYVQGAPQGNDEQTFAYGGGMFTDYATVKLRHLRFENNLAKGGGEQNEYGGSAAGGGLAIRKTMARAQLERLVFVSNRSESGSGRLRGGYALGSGMFILFSEVDGSELEFYENVSQAGNTSAGGRTADGQTADAFGAVAIAGYADVTLRNLTVQRNRSFGASAQIYAGGAYGGAIMAEGHPGSDLDQDGILDTTTVRITGCKLSDNLVQGGNGGYGGISGGGAIMTIHATISIEGCKILNNTSQGGNGSNAQGPAGGGGLYLQNILYGEPTATVKNSVIAFNKVAAGQGPVVGGGGGGVWLQGISATLRHNTIVGNRMLTHPLQGAALLVMSYGVNTGAKPADVRYNIIANHTDVGSSALHVQPDNTANLDHNLFFGNASNIHTSQAGTIHGMDTSILQDPLFLDDSTGENPFRIPATSPAVDRAKGSTETTDVENNPRNGIPDIGAYEAAPFRLTAFPTASGSVRVHWNAQTGVSSYQMTVRCPPSANPPDGFACNQPARLNGDADGVLLTGLTNHTAYTVLVSGLDGNGNVILSAETTALPTDLFVYAPLIIR